MLVLLVPLAATVSSAGTATRNADDETCAGPGAASYARFSTELQDKRSITDQQRKCREHAERDGTSIRPDLEFVDEATSGAKPSQGFDAMMSAARGGRFKVLYVESLSRLARDSVLNQQTLRELARVHAVRIVSIDDGLDTRNANWELPAIIHGWQNEQYLTNLSHQVFRGQEGLVLDGLSVGDYCFGYKSEAVPGAEVGSNGKNRRPKTRYVICEPEARWVWKIFLWFVRERRTLRWIARELNCLGAPKDHRATTTEWSHQLVAGLLKNRKYIGIWPWGERKNFRNENGAIRQELRPATETEKWARHFPELRIIDDETFSKAQELLEKNAEAHGKRRGKKQRFTGSTPESAKANPRHLLSGLIECGYCGRRFHVGGKNGKYLFCPGFHKGVCPCQTQLGATSASG